jgi:hypothetical protein
MITFATLVIAGDADSTGNGSSGAFRNGAWPCFRRPVLALQEVAAGRPEAAAEDQVSLPFSPRIPLVCAACRTSRRGFPALSPHRT